MGVQLIGFPLAGAGGREVTVNPDQVVCVIDVGENRTQIVTTGLSGQASMSLIVERSHSSVIHALSERT